MRICHPYNDKLLKKKYRSVCQLFIVAIYTKLRKKETVFQHLTFTLLQSRLSDFNILLFWLHES